MLSVGRSSVEDITAIHKLVEGDAFIFRKRYGDDYNFHSLIEKGFLSVTLRDEADEIVGFASLSDFPATAKRIPAARWDEWLHSGWLEPGQVDNVRPCNTLWMTCFVGSDAACSGFDLLMKVLTTALTTVPRIENVLFALPDEAPPFAPISDIFIQLKASKEPEGDFKGSVWHITRQDVIPPLKLRAGVVEDYDDLMPLILSGEGLVTPLPPNLYLEELLQDQDEQKAVVVALDPLTQEVVGLMCLKAESTDLQHYVIGDYTELKQLVSRSHGKRHGQQQGNQKGLIHITFLYLKPAYDSRATQLVPHAFEVFPQAEYIYIRLPHAQPEHPVLYNFTYVPIKEFKPSGGQNDRPSLDGLWLLCKHALDSVSVMPVAQVHETAATKLISSSELPQDVSEAMCLALSQSVPLGADQQRQGGNQAPFASYVMLWGEQVVGAAIIRHISVEEMYSLRENFALDDFVNFVPNGDHHLGQTDISVDPSVAQSTFYRNDMPGVVVKYAYLKPVFRCRMRLLLSEVLRLSGGEVALNLAGPSTQTYSTLLAELILTPPRRMIDHPLEKNDEDVDSLVCLHCTTRKALSDEKTKIHARIIVVGAGTTGLAFIYSLIKIPYLHFDNILLVSRDGLPNHPMHRDLLWTVDTMDWLEREYIFLQVGKKLRVIEDTMTAFERHEFYITLESSHHKNEPYDYLVITAGRQYALPKELSATHGSKNGVFALSHEKYIERIKQHIHESEIYEDDRSNAVIYGCSLDVYCVATAIMDLNLAPQRIVIVSPYDPTVVKKQRSYEDDDDDDDEFGPAFDDPTVEMKVEALLERLGVKLYKGYELRGNASCMDEDGDKNLTSVVISPMGRGSDGKDIEINATMFIYAHEKDIDTQLLSALNKQSIVFDGRVIIENSYRTTNPHIFAAGPVAMFSRRFGGSRNFDNFSALEIGQHLCHTVLGFLGIDEFINKDLEADDKDVVLRDDPLAAQIGTSKKDAAQASAAEVARRRPKPLPQYTNNVCRRVVLPSGFQYFTCYSMTYEFIRDRCTQLTSSPSETSYLCLSIGPNKYIESVVFFGSDPVELYNLRSLVGMPESVLNLLYNYNEQKDEHGNPSLDLLQYFRSPWSYAIFYDRFQQLYQNVKGQLNDHPDVKRIKQDILQVALKEGTDTISDDERYSYHRRLSHDASDSRHVIELELLKYLHRNKAFIPQRYFLPDISTRVENLSVPPS